jgi:hypothetical protein
MLSILSFNDLASLTNFSSISLSFLPAQGLNPRQYFFGGLFHFSGPVLMVIGGRPWLFSEYGSVNGKMFIKTAHNTAWATLTPARSVCTLRQIN